MQFRGRTACQTDSGKDPCEEFDQQGKPAYEHTDMVLEREWFPKT